MTDLAGGSNFLFLALLTFCEGALPQANIRQIIITALVCAWAVRLSGFLFYRVIKFESDSRFDGMRENVCQFLVFWIIQMIWVWTVSLPVIYVNTSNCDTSFGATDYVGVIIAGVGLIIETSADTSKFLYK